MDIKYNTEIDSNTIKDSLKRLTNQIYKLLPEREEGVNWQSPLESIIVEISGMSRLLNQELLFQLLCRLEGLFTLTEIEDFPIFRKTIFECLGLINKLNNGIR